MTKQSPLVDDLNDLTFNHDASLQTSCKARLDLCYFETVIGGKGICAILVT